MGLLLDGFSGGSVPLFEALPIKGGSITLATARCSAVKGHKLGRRGLSVGQQHNPPQRQPQPTPNAASPFAFH